MLLITKCQSCCKNVKLRTWATDRVDLARTKGEFIGLSCKSCKTTEYYHVDSFSAQPGRLAKILALLIFVVGTPLIIIFIWEALWTLRWSYSIFAVAGLMLIPVTVFGIIHKEDMRKVCLFNRYKLEGSGSGHPKGRNKKNDN